MSPSTRLFAAALLLCAAPVAAQNAAGARWYLGTYGNEILVFDEGDADAKVATDLNVTRPSLGRRDEGEGRAEGERSSKEKQSRGHHTSWARGERSGEGLAW